jgi:hypothetical protein
MKVFPTMPPGRRPSLILLFILGLLIITISIRSFTRPTDTNPTPSQPIIDYQGPIIDAVTGLPVLADVFVDARLVERETDMANAQLSFEASDQSVTLSVMAPGYEPWIQAFQATGDRTSVQATVKLIPRPTPAADEAPASIQTTTPAQKAKLRFQSHIIDAATNLPVIADVRLNGETVRWDITYLDLEVVVDEEDFFQLEVVAAGYEPWVIQGRGHFNEDKAWQGPIQLVRQAAPPKASKRPTFYPPSLKDRQGITSKLV